MNDNVNNVITIDGPGGSGKGTISRIIAHRLGWNYLDSGALYRVVGLAALRRGLALDAESQVGELASELDVVFENSADGGEGRILLEGEDVAAEIRTEQVASAASRVAAMPDVRLALLGRQRVFSRPPGLVADGRDMGSAVFTDASLKIFLTASQQERANRRYKQLKEKGIDVSLSTLFEEIERRDTRDSGRSASPMTMADDAILLDTTETGIEDVVEQILGLWRRVPAVMQQGVSYFETEQSGSETEQAD